MSVVIICAVVRFLPLPAHNLPFTSAIELGSLRFGKNLVNFILPALQCILDGLTRSRDWWQSDQKEVHQKPTFRPPFFPCTNSAQCILQYWSGIFGVYWHLRSLDRILTLCTSSTFLDVLLSSYVQNFLPFTWIGLFTSLQDVRPRCNTNKRWKLHTVS